MYPNTGIELCKRVNLLYYIPYAQIFVKLLLQAYKDLLCILLPKMFLAVPCDAKATLVGHVVDCASELVINLTIDRGWKQTNLWMELRARSGADQVWLTLENCLPNIETVLRSGGTSAPDFTLHDHDHSYRVAQRMANLLGSAQLADLSNLELALLLLSAYLHDIGMTPGRDQVKGRENGTYLAPLS
jgi:hypothetical protein